MPNLTTRYLFDLNRAQKHASNFLHANTIFSQAEFYQGESSFSL
jgi:hypothetical protein